MRRPIHHRQSFRARRFSAWHRRTGASTLDYILVLGVILPLAAIVLPMGMRMIALVYEMICVLTAWPFL